MTDEPNETAGETTATSTKPAKIRQAHGGALNSGGTKGNKGGRPPSAVRDACRADFDKLRPILKTIALGHASKQGRKAAPAADGEIGGELAPVTTADRIRAIDVLAKYGMEANISITDVRECLKNTQRELFDFLPREQAETVWARIAPHWLKL
jgi:hypothetical protein